MCSNQVYWYLMTACGSLLGSASCKKIGEDKYYEVIDAEIVSYDTMLATLLYGFDNDDNSMREYATYPDFNKNKDFETYYVLAKKIYDVDDNIASSLEFNGEDDTEILTKDIKDEFETKYFKVKNMMDTMDINTLVETEYSGNQTCCRYSIYKSDTKHDTLWIPEKEYLKTRCTYK